MIDDTSGEMRRRQHSRHLLNVGILVAMLTLLWIPDECRAATIDVDRSGRQPLITVIGDLNLEDGGIFADKISGLTEGVVLLNSPGGNLFAGLRICTLIRLGNFSTFVPDGVRCASACAFAWLGGMARYKGERALGGF